MLRQRGISLFIVLIALVVMTMGAIALTKSVDVANLASGSITFRKNAVNVSDIGAEAALVDLNGIPVSALTTTVANRYYANKLTLDSSGLPTGVDWNKAPSVPATDGYSAAYVIERLCDPISGCMTYTPPAGAGGNSQRAGSDSFSATPSGYYFRITVRTTGPRSTVSWVQATVMK